MNAPRMFCFPESRSEVADLGNGFSSLCGSLHGMHPSTVTELGSNWYVGPLLWLRKGQKVAALDSVLVLRLERLSRIEMHRSHC